MNRASHPRLKMKVQAPWRAHHSRLGSRYMRPIRPIISVMVTPNRASSSGMPRLVSCTASTGTGPARCAIDSVFSSSKVATHSAPTAHSKWPSPSSQILDGGSVSPWGISRAARWLSHCAVPQPATQTRKYTAPGSSSQL